MDTCICAANWVHSNTTWWKLHCIASIWINVAPVCLTRLTCNSWVCPMCWLLESTKEESYCTNFTENLLTCYKIWMLWQFVLAHVVTSIITLFPSQALGYFVVRITRPGPLVVVRYILKNRSKSMNCSYLCKLSFFQKYIKCGELFKEFCEIYVENKLNCAR